MVQHQTEGRALPFAMSEALSMYKPSPLDSSRLRQAKRTPEERWEEHNALQAQHQKALKATGNILKLAEQYPGLDTSELAKAIAQEI